VIGAVQAHREGTKPLRRPKELVLDQTKILGLLRPGNEPVKLDAPEMLDEKKLAALGDDSPDKGPRHGSSHGGAGSKKSSSSLGSLE